MHLICDLMRICSSFFTHQFYKIIYYVNINCYFILKFCVKAYITHIKNNMDKRKQFKYFFAQLYLYLLKPVTNKYKTYQYSVIFKMKKIIISVLLIQLTITAINFRLSTNEVNKLNPGDSLISTLGYFQATLVQNKCIFSISSFSDTTKTYIKVGNYSSPNVTDNCQYLQAIDGQIVTENNSTYMSVGSGYNQSTILTIDDNGIIRLIGTYNLQNTQVSEQFSVDSFYKNQTFIVAETNLTINFRDQFPTITNLRGWQFSASFGLLQIAQKDNNGIFVSYFYSKVGIGNSQITDFNGKTFPGVIFPNITFKPRCVEPRLYLNFKPPFVFVADPYWPIFTLYEQGRYKVLQVSFADLSALENKQKSQRFSFRAQSSVCPPYTFELKGQCVTTCPYPYYHEMRSQFGYCVLTCEEYTPKNDSSRICTCSHSYESIWLNSQFIKNCTSDSTAYPYGCYCKAPNYFFDRQNTFACVKNCTNGTFPSNGLCMKCPKNCIRCQKDQLFRMYLQCKVCEQGYTLNQGQCQATCNNQLGLSIVNGVCQQCSDPNCIQCINNIDECTKCGPLYSLSNSACLQSCPNNTKLVVTNNFTALCFPFDSQCVGSLLITHYKNQPYIKCSQCNNGRYAHLKTCVPSCPNGYTANLNGYCVCSNGLLTINDKCLPLPVCPITLGLDLLSQSCLSCPFGCLTCINNICTSCSPGYFLYISPLAMRCRRKSPLFTCTGEYAWIQNTCLVIDYTDPDLLVRECISNVQNCMVCNFNDNVVCILCNKGYYNVNNTCIKNCPKDTIPYDNTCILTQITNCSSNYLLVNPAPFILNYEKILDSNPYKYYTLNGTELLNDPVGYIPLYQMLSTKKNDGQFRQSEFFQPQWTCLKCNDGYGLAINFTACLPCPNPCLTCYMASNVSCLSYKDTGCKTFTDSQTGNCLSSCSSDNFVPTLINGTLYCTPLSRAPVNKVATIDSSIYEQSDGTKHIFFIFGDTLQSKDLQIPLTLSTKKVSSVAKVGANSLPSSLNVQSGNYLTFTDKNSNNLAYIINLTTVLPSLVSTNNLYFPNSVYGVTPQQSHPQFMKTWLAIIGQIMGCVMIILHAVFIGNDLIYKVDNALILTQTIYFFSFVKLLVGKLLAQFYYGWIYSHAGFFPNFFANKIPSNYVEYAAPNSYKLATLDSNIVRNAGFTMSLLLVFIGCYAVITITVYLIHILFRKEEIWYPKLAVNSLIAGLQFFSMNLFFWSVANIQYIAGADILDSDFAYTSKSVSIFFIVIITLYTIGRWVFNPLGGLYMAKRILIATILAVAYQDLNYIAPLVLLETVFTIIRYFMEEPQQKKQKIYLSVQYFLYITVYLLLFLCLNSGVNTIIISLIIFVIIVFLAHDLSDIYLESQNQWPIDDEESIQSEQMAKAHAQRRSSLYEKH